jgi:hypothetical protein
MEYNYISVFTSEMENTVIFVGSEVLTAVVIFWDITPCTPLKFKRRFGGHIASIFRVEE